MVVGPSSSSSSSASSVSSLTSFGGGSCDEAVAAVKGLIVKFLCSYGGKILPRHPDGRLRYVRGDTRVLAVDRAVSYSELAAKMAEICGWGVPVSVRCQLPTEDLDALVSLTSDEDLANLLEEYDLASKGSPFKIRAVLAPQQQQQHHHHHHHHHSAPMKAPVTASSSASRGNSPSASEHRRAAHGLPPQHFPCAAASNSRLPTRPPTSVSNGQARYLHEHHYNRASVIHGGVGGGPGVATSYRTAGWRCCRRGRVEAAS